jgi:hypothetical protein
VLGLPEIPQVSRSLRTALAAIAFAWCAIAGSPEAAAKGSPFLEALDPAEAMRSPAYRYANMSNDEAYAELDRRRVLYVRERPTDGVRAPIRLTGRLHGVHVHSTLPPEQRPTTPFEVLDARLALALDDFCAILARHEVVELVHYTMYRPNVPPAGWSPGAPIASGAAASKPSTAKAPPARPRAPGAKAKKRNEAGLGKGQKPGGKAGGGDRSRARQKTDAADELPLAGPFAICDHGHDEPLEGEDLDIEGDVDAFGAKAAPRKNPAPRQGRVTKTSRRAAPALRRPPSRSEVDEPNTHRKWAPPGTRHPAGLAIDVGGVRKKDGRWLSIASHFQGNIGERTCGPGAPTPTSAEARELRAIVCEARGAGVFTYALTPNFDADHVDHVHFEIKPGVTWFLFH